MNEIQSFVGATWGTCSPVNFRGCEIYVSRDAGLVGEGFRAIGLDCKSILLAPKRDGDLEHIIRLEEGMMSDPEWWKGKFSGGVVFYNSSGPSGFRFLTAAKAGGVQIALNIDNAVIFDLMTSPRAFWRKSLLHKSTKGPVVSVALAVAACIKSLLRIARGRYHSLADHFAIADVIAVVTPEATHRMKAFLKRYGRADAVDRVHLVPHPVHPRFVLGRRRKSEKRLTVVSVGRWDDWIQKRSDILIEVISGVLTRDTLIDFEIFGRPDSRILKWHALLDDNLKERVRIYGVVPNRDMVEAYQRSNIYLCVSAYESFMIAGGEAICCGCSIVAPDLDTLPGPRWFGGANRGTLAKRLNSNSIGDALRQEIDHWRCGHRNPEAIARWGRTEMHATRVAAAYRKLLEHR